MKKLKINIIQVFLIIFSTSFLLVSCNNQDLVEENTINTTNILKTSNRDLDDLTESETIELKESLDYSMDSFINSLRPFYKRNMSYQDFLEELDPENSLNGMNVEADDLLQYSFNFIKQNKSFRDLDNSDLLLKAFKSGLEDYDDNVELTTETIEEINLSIFNLDLSKDNSVFNKGSCKWYQVGCHLNNFWNWLWGDKLDELEPYEIILGLMAIVMGGISIYNEF